MAYGLLWLLDSVATGLDGLDRPLSLLDYRLLSLLDYRL